MGRGLGWGGALDAAFVDEKGPWIGRGLGCCLSKVVDGEGPWMGRGFGMRVGKIFKVLQMNSGCHLVKSNNKS